MQRNVQQMRPANDPKGLVYAPQRDLVNLYPAMMAEVFTGLDQNNWAPHFREWFESKGLTQDQISTSVKLFFEAHRLFIRDREVSCPADAFARACEAEQILPAVSLSLFARLGEVFMGGMFVALRDVTLQGVESHVHQQLMEMLAAGRDLSERLSGELAKQDVSDLSRWKEDAIEQKRINQQLQQLVSRQQAEIADLQSRIQTCSGTCRAGTTTE